MVIGVMDRFLVFTGHKRFAYFLDGMTPALRRSCLAAEERTRTIFVCGFSTCALASEIIQGRQDDRYAIGG